MRKFYALIVSLALAVGIAASAQTMTVSGSYVTDSTGTPLASGTITFAPVDNHGHPLSYRMGGKGQTLDRAVTAIVTNGAFSLVLPDVNYTNPQNVCFSVTATDSTTGDSVLGSDYQCVQPSSGMAGTGWCSSTESTCDFDEYVPNSPWIPVETIAGGSSGGGGSAATVSIGTVTTGTPAAVTNSGTSTNAVFNFTIPQGATGPTGATGAAGAAATVSIGTVTTGAPDTAASVTNSGTSTNAVLNFTIPKGETGATGPQGSGGDGGGVQAASCQGQLGGSSTAIVQDTYTALCYNDTGQTWTITGFHAYADSGSTTISATNAEGVALLSAPVTASPGMPSGTLTTTSIASGDYIKMSIVTDGTTKHVMPVFTLTYPAPDGTETGAPSFNLGAATAPTINPASGSYTGAQTVTLADTTAGANIYYTTDGTTPSVSSTQYTGTFQTVGSGSETVKAIAIASGYSNSSVSSAAYTIEAQAPTPTFSVAAGTYSTTQSVTISDSLSGSSIYYTTDGSTPTTSSTLYTGAISVSASETLSAIAVYSGYANSSVGSAAYTIGSPIAFVQATGANGHGAVALSLTCTAGDTLLVFGGSYSSTDTLSVTGDTASLIATVNASGSMASMFRVASCTGGAETITVASAADTYMDASVIEVKGSTGVDSYVTGSNGEYAASLTLTTTAPTTLLVAGMFTADEGPGTATGWTEVGYTDGTNRETTVQYLKDTSAGSITWAPYGGSGAGGAGLDSEIMVALK